MILENASSEFVSRKVSRALIQSEQELKDIFYFSAGNSDNAYFTNEIIGDVVQEGCCIFMRDV